ncbi:pantoate--beta-alanine ligase [Virgibacillus subterraneus]|uniref:Pantothenate synthetase n=1 Tax=Virgibacillus subterraneus TaxID=621109 RepID=A0A1H9ELQ2_9BACI|nr:pantoate--beta-alanine ligase [Virgibacillus subterraneus]SEQ26565.1 pantoate--beta-alanine ligase [Virgibacillus subterraneus]
MKIIRSTTVMQEKMIKISKSESIGFVPTMGYFHEGHLALMKQAAEDNDVVVTSIFVNPLQFGPNEDYEQYPRDEEQDIRLAEQAGVDILFIPSVKDMYPTKMNITLSVEERANVLCGRSRPGHFEGVITVLTKLFNIIRPNNTYFGLKDAQQVAVVDALINDLNFPIQLIALPTIREHDGLAKSSRNVNLANDERSQAVWLTKALEHGHQLVVDGEQNPAIIVKEVIDVINRETSGTVDYVEMLSYPDLQSVSTIKNNVVLAVAVQFKRARLIDNIIFNENGKLIRQFY